MGYDKTYKDFQEGEALINVIDEKGYEEANLADAIRFGKSANYLILI